MSGFDWTGWWIGMLAGGALGALFFAGLAWGMTMALKRAHPSAILLASAAVRMAVLLASGWCVATWLGLAGVLGWALAFVLSRVVLVARIGAWVARRTA